MAAIAALGCGFLTGCAPKPVAAGHWKVTPEGLVPPLPAASYELKQARGGRKKGCEFKAEGIRMEWKGRTARVEADSAALRQAAATVATDSGTKGQQRELSGFVLTRNWFREDLRPALMERAAKGCLTAEESRVLQRRVAERLTISTNRSFRVLYGDYTLEGYVDLEPVFRLKAIEPVREGGEVVGFKSSYYALRAAPGGGVRVEAAGADTNRKAVITKGEATDGAVLHVPERARYMRLFLRTWSTRMDRRIAILAAGSQAEIEAATKAFEADAEGYCAGAAAKGQVCVDVSKDTVIGPELRVLVNGTEQWAPLGGGLSDVLRSMNVRPTQELVEKLRIERPFEGRLAEVEFDRTGMDILGFVFTGGERVSW